ncbi:MAG: ATP-binding protein [Solirubrobacteraceae bacterium]
MYVTRSKLLAPLAALVLTVGTLIGLWTLVARATASREAQLRISSLTLSLDNLAIAPFGADPATGGSAAANLAKIRADEASIGQGLTARDQPGEPASMLAAGSADLHAIEPVVKAIYGLAVHGGLAAAGARVPKLNGLLVVRSAALSGVLGKIARTDAAHSADSRAQMKLGVAGAMLLMLLAFEFFFFRSAADRAAVERMGNEARRAAEANAAARDAAVEASQAKSMFIAAVSHELRTPLTGVLGMTELALDGELDPQQHQYIHMAHSAAEGLLLVINDILDYSKIEAGKIELEAASFSPRETIGEACAMLALEARAKGVELAVRIDRGVPTRLCGDAARLRQVIVNLVSNAVKFTDSGSINVAATGAGRDGHARLHVEVRDSGIGIDAQTLAQLFQPFVQGDSSTARKYGGTGLGLTISARLIEAMGGTIRASSECGEGSTFWFEVTLPMADASEPAELLVADHRLRCAPAPPGDSLGVVLVAEDNPVNQIIAARMLEKLGYGLELVADGNQALEAIAKTDYAAVLMDCQMPAMDGYEATREIRRREHGAAHLPIVAMTANAMSGDRAKCLAAGMDDYISKPMRAALLGDILSRCLRNSHPHDLAGTKR